MQNQCGQCKNVKDGPYCVPECPLKKYDNENGVCRPCHSNCRGGCTGPGNKIGEGACNQCQMAVLDIHGNVSSCLSPDREDCDEGYYKGVKDGQQVTK